ncbi:hypothetical protein K437DRAFT_267764 [Tilletiaria anomala UBC 951]|uniref:Nucleolar protein 9 n=1 Tax=Tilletiaria anomala (strain ATCC 24038 / CBS 436.72 / UBC 951) TaxID=1037660 RepID=A0A066W171_TILAU|nr:uncharacterized protein K437DRAFT_267764 [Tilletiaria anomala UBC 951]KDN47717.1 hypothetical protein K437DRAFT_267764 [Tilletiaria anomala UBC 951]
MAKKGFAGHKERKRGKKKSKVVAELTVAAVEEPSESIIDTDLTKKPAAQQEGEDTDGQLNPSWVVSESSIKPNDADDVAPFGYVDADVKAYFKDVHAKLKEAEWAAPQKNRSSELGEDIDGENEHSLLLNAAIREMDGKELRLATDPDTSIALEYIIEHMKEKQMRILVDRMTGR